MWIYKESGGGALKWSTTLALTLSQGEREYDRCSP